MCWTGIHLKKACFRHYVTKCGFYYIILCVAHESIRRRFVLGIMLHNVYSITLYYVLHRNPAEAGSGASRAAEQAGWERRGDHSVTTHRRRVQRLRRRLRARGQRLVGLTHQLNLGV